MPQPNNRACSRPQNHGLVRFVQSTDYTAIPTTRANGLNPTPAGQVRLNGPNRIHKLTFDELRKYLENRKGATEEFPFGPRVMVFKVMGKMFALIGLDEDPLRINLKCDPELALHLRNAFHAVKPGYHMNKKHWNTVVLDGSIPDAEVRKMIDESYDLVVKGLKKSDRERLGKTKYRNRENAQ